MHLDILEKNRYFDLMDVVSNDDSMFMLEFSYGFVNSLSKEDIIYSIEENKEIIAFAILYTPKVAPLSDYFNKEDCNHVEYVYVKKEFRGKGYSSEILDTLISESALPLYATVHPDNVPSLSLFKGKGFEIIKKDYNYNDTYLGKRVILRKNIDFF